MKNLAMIFGIHPFNSTNIRKWYSQHCLSWSLLYNIQIVGKGIDLSTSICTSHLKWRSQWFRIHDTQDGIQLYSGGSFPRCSSSRGTIPLNLDILQSMDSHSGIVFHVTLVTGTHKAKPTQSWQWSHFGRMDSDSNRKVRYRWCSRSLLTRESWSYSCMCVHLSTARSIVCVILIGVISLSVFHRDGNRLFRLVVAFSTKLS